VRFRSFASRENVKTFT